MIITNLKGGVGNQMFQYAAGVALARRHGVELKMDLNFLDDRSKRVTMFTLRDYALDMFKVSAGIATNREIRRFTLPRTVNRYLYRMLQYIYPKRCFYQDVTVEEFREIPSSAYLTGYWQEKGYYVGYEDDIRREFTFRNPLPASCTSVERAIRSSVNPVSLHVRRGDYVGHPTLDGVVGREYYKDALEYLRHKIGEDFALFIFSDDIEWCRRELDVAGVETLFVTSEYTAGKAEYDLHLMTLCRHFVIANSSFSFWGAWLSASRDKIVVAPARWKHGQQYEKKPTIPDDWVLV